MIAEISASSMAASVEGEDGRMTNRALSKMGTVTSPRSAVTRSGGYRSPIVVSSQLGHASEKFSSFYQDLEHERSARRAAEVQARATLLEQIAKIEHAVDMEVKRRMDSDKTLQAGLEAELASLQEKMREQSVSTRASVEALTRTVAELQSTLREEREQRRTDLERLAASVVTRMDDLQSAIDDERVARLEREAQTVKRVGEDVFRLQEAVDFERSEREALAAELRTLQDQVRRLGRGREEQNFEATLRAEVAELRAELQVEHDERISEDEQIVNALNDYTHALQDGLRLINQQ